MKKTVKILAISVMLVVLISAMALPVFATRHINAVADYEPDTRFGYVDILVMRMWERRDLTALVPELDGVDVTWSTTDDKIVQVSSEGIVKAITKGTVYVTGTYVNANNETMNVYFYISSVDNVQEDYGVVKLSVGDTFNIADLFMPALVEREYTGITTRPLAFYVNINTGDVTARDVGTNTVTVHYTDANGDDWAFPLVVQVTE